MSRTNSKAVQTDLLGNNQKVNVLDGYNQGNMDNSTDPVAIPSYYGFTDTDGNWYVQKILNGYSEYARGTTDYSTNWTNRVSLIYAPFDQVF